MSFRLLPHRSPLIAWAMCVVASLAWGDEQTAASKTAAERGYDFLVNKAYLPPDFTQATFDEVWTQWPSPLREEAEKATPEERRRMAFSRYGLTPRPEDPTKPLQYVVDDAGNWTMNCFACHGGKVVGKVIPGLPNSHFALETLVEETRALKVAKGTPLGRMDVGSIFVPLGSSNGTTNAVMFGVVLMHFRDADLNWHARSRPKLVNHDMDAPAWWHFHRKRFLYIDGFASKGHRGLMQFMMVKQNGPEKFREWEADFQDVYAYLQSLRPPKYPFEIDAPLASQGETVFNHHCAECHGTYGKDASYPERNVPMHLIRTDRVRLDSLTVENRAGYGRSWFNDYGKQPNLENPGGYVAPPLDGVWASAPYFHNGSVPTLHGVLHPQERPWVWKRTEDGYDREKVGLEIESFERMPADVTQSAELRRYFNTRSYGKSDEGHMFVDKLTAPEKRAVLEYLKTL